MSFLIRLIANPIVRYYRDLFISIKNNEINKTARIAPGAVISNSKIYSFASIGAGAELINVELGCYSYVSAGCRVANSKIGSFCSIGSNVVIAPGRHPVGHVSTHPIFYSSYGQCAKKWVANSTFSENGEVDIGADVWIGINAVIFDDVKIGVGAIIGASAVVTHDVEAYSVVVGIPAKKIKRRFDDKICESLIDSQWWNLEPTWIENNVNLFRDPEKFLEKINELKAKSNTKGF